MFLRSARFDYKDFMYSQSFNVVFLLPKKVLEGYREFFNVAFFNEILKYAK